MLADYVGSGGALPSQAAQAMANEAERLLRAADRAAWARPSFRHKALLYVLLGGDRRVAEHLLRVSPRTCVASATSPERTCSVMLCRPPAALQDVCVVICRYVPMS